VLGHGAVEGDAADAEGNSIGERDAENSAGGRDDQRLREELEEDVAAARAEGLFDADLAGALLDGDQHDVHEADAGDAEGARR
jgi:hypothetical protein